MSQAQGSTEVKPVVIIEDKPVLNPDPISKWLRIVMWMLMIALLVVFTMFVSTEIPPPSPNPRDAIRDAVGEVVSNTIDNIPQQCFKVDANLTKEEVDYLLIRAFGQLKELEQYSYLPLDSDKPPSKPNCIPEKNDFTPDKHRSLSYDILKC